MGLDVYLHTALDAAMNDAHDKASEAYYGRPDFDQLTKEERDAASAELPPYASHADVPSERYPDHLFNRRYLRSSYNSGGFNHAVPEMIGSSGDETYPGERGSLYWIFQPMGREWDGDEGILTHDDVPKLLRCKERAETVAAELRKSDRLRTITVSPNIFGGQPRHTADDALRMYRGLGPGPVSFGDDAWYSTEDIEVFGKGVSILAAVAGVGTFKEPAVHLISRADDGVETYAQSAEITAEFCDEAISLIEHDGGARISWSG